MPDWIRAVRTAVSRFGPHIWEQLIPPGGLAGGFAFEMRVVRYPYLCSHQSLSLFERGWLCHSCLQRGQSHGQHHPRLSFAHLLHQWAE